MKLCLILWLHSLSTSNVQLDDANEVSRFFILEYLQFQINIQWSTHSLLFYFIVRVLIYLEGHKCLSINKGLVMNRGQKHWSAAHQFNPTANCTPLCPAKLHHNQLVAIFNYNTWTTLTRQPRPWKPAGARGRLAGAHCYLWTSLSSCHRKGELFYSFAAVNNVEIWDLQWKMEL